MHSVALFIICVVFFNTTHVADNCNNQSNKYLDDLFVAYQQAELKDQQKISAQKILNFVALNNIFLDSWRLKLLEHAYKQYGCAVFPGLLDKTKIHHYQSSSPVQHLSYQDIREPIVAKNKDMTIELARFSDSLQFTTYIQDKKIQSFNRSTNGFLDVEIETFFKDSLWHVIIYSYNTQVRDKTLFSFFPNGDYTCHKIPQNFDKQKFSRFNHGLISMICDVHYNQLQGPSYEISIQHSLENNLKVLKTFSENYNPKHAMNVTTIEENDSFLVWIDNHLYMRNLATDELSDLGQSNFSSISKISFTNNGRIAWIEGCPKEKPLTHSLLQAWNLKTMKYELGWHSSAEFARNYIFSPNGVLCVGIRSSNKANKIFLCDASNGFVLAQFTLEKQIADYSFKSNSEILISCGKNDWYNMDIATLQMANWIAKQKPFNQLIHFFQLQSNQILMNSSMEGSLFQVFDL